MNGPWPAAPLLLLIAGCGASAGQPPDVPPPVPVQLVDVAESSGIRFRHSHGGYGRKFFVETSGAGACFFDYDEDGDADLYVVQSGVLPTRPGFGGKANRSVLYRSSGAGRFDEVTDAAGVANLRYGQGACAGDYDGDGDLDLYVTNFGDNRLYRNNGNGTFTDVASSAKATCPGYNTSAAFSDIDLDGDLDLYVARYARYRIGMDPRCSQAPGLHSYCPPAQFEGEVDVLLRNNGDGTFADVTVAAGVADKQGKGLGVLFVDYDRNGLPDLFVANDGTLNRLYHNLGKGRFEDVTSVAGVGLNESGIMAAGMGTDAADTDDDGMPDIFVANFSGEPNDLYRNRGDGTFETRSTQSGLGEPSLPFSGFGAQFVDYDLDGYQDLFVANGHVADDIDTAQPGITYAEPDSLYRRIAPGQFEDVSSTVGRDLVRPTVSRGLAVADVDGDGDVDFFVTNCNGTPNLFRNDGGNQRNWIRLRLRAASGDRHALGAAVTLQAGGRTQTREVRSGASYCSQSELTLTFGVDRAAKVDRVTIRWPGRGTQEWRDLPARREHLLREVPWPRPRGQ
jgi:enediyne biosynthesis protein E4